MFLTATADSRDPVTAQRDRYDRYDEPHPAIAITLHEDHVQGVFDGLRAGRIELALTYDLTSGRTSRSSLW